VLAVKAAHSRFDVVIGLQEIDQVIWIICGRVVFAIALAETIYERGAMMKFYFLVAEVLADIEGETLRQ
jgi:hypothetical protein